VDPRNPDLHEALVWILAASGSRPAAFEEYSHFVALFRDEYGADPSGFDDIATGHFLASRLSPSIRN